MTPLHSAHQLWFDAPGIVTVRELDLPEPGPGEVSVRTLISAISAGTELLYYRGQVPPALLGDATIAALQEVPGYPLRYGYAAVGLVSDCGAGVAQEWHGRRVFAFQPHASRFVARVEELLPVPAAVSTEQAAFYANMETAVTLTQDAAPLLGERVVLFGLGVVGLLTALQLSAFPLAELLCVEAASQRRVRAAALGLAAVPPETLPPDADFDLALELSGSPSALEAALHAVGYSGRVVIGSWYGDKPVSLPLGGAYHRNRVQIVGSQVSTIAPALRGRWDRARRTAATWARLAALDSSTLITHRFALDAAPEAYSMLSGSPESMLQVIFEFPHRD